MAHLSNLKEMTSRKIFNIYTTAILFAFFVSINSAVFAYEIDTHYKLTKSAFNSSNLVADPSLLSDIGLYPQYAYPNSLLEKQLLNEIMAFGAQLEDGCENATKGSLLCDEHGEPNGLNGLNHFYDPQTGRGLTFPFENSLFCRNAVASIDWATERNGQIEPRNDCGALAIVGQKYSYMDALEYYRKMLTEPNANVRSDNVGLLFRSLGSILHHLQDMAQPEHVRDDMHCPDMLCLAVDIAVDVGSSAAGSVLDLVKLNLYDPSGYEKYTNEKSVYNGCIEPKLNSINYPTAVEFSKPWLYWDSDDGRGMAEFTSNHFVSPQTNFAGSPFNPEPHSSIHPKPDPDTKSNNWRVEEVGILNLLSNCDKEFSERYHRLRGSVKFVTQNIVDPYFSSVEYKNIRTSAWSVFTNDLVKKDSMLIFSMPKFSLNQFVYQSLYDVLLPRAVAFSSGLIDYFFRGRLDVTVGSSGNTITIKNISKQKMAGKFLLLYDDAVLTRSELKSTDMTLNPNQTSAEISFTVPSPSAGFDGRYIVVFDGQIGDYDGITAKEFKVTIEPPKPATCGDPITPSGGKGVHQIPYEFTGSNKQTLDLYFEAFSIPDRLKVYAKGNLLIDTNDLVSGFHQYRIDVDPSKLGNKLDIYVDAPNEGTQWKLCIDCEDSGQSCEQKMDRKKVSFSFGPVGPWWTCRFDGQIIDGVTYEDKLVIIYMTPGKHQYVFNGRCTCDSSSGLGCETDPPSVIIDGYKKLDLTQSLKFEFDVD